MKKLLFTTIIGLAVCAALAQANIPIQIMPNHQISNYSDKKLIEITKLALADHHVDIGRNSNYRLAKVQLFFTKQSEPYLLVHLMSKYFTSYKIIRINLKNGSVRYSLANNYKLTANDFLAQRKYVKNVPQCPIKYQTSRPLFVIGTPCYGGISNVYRMVNMLSQSVLDNQQYQLVQLLDNDATIANYQNILACSNLKYFFHIGGEDEYGKSFFLADGDFDASYFANNPQLDLSSKVISFDTCRAFDQVPGGFCPLITSMPHPPAVYTTGSSELLIWGSTETYGCFWKQILENNAPITKETLENCAKQYDPSVPDSQSGIYFIGEHSGDEHIYDRKIVIKTNLRTLSVFAKDYAILNLESDESVQQYSVQTDSKTIICSPAPSNTIKLLNNPGLKAAEFGLRYYPSTQSNQESCQYEEISRIQREGGIREDIYGFYPEDKSCFVQPSKLLQLKFDY